jgi:hypothetical protein
MFLGVAIPEHELAKKRLERADLISSGGTPMSLACLDGEISEHEGHTIESELDEAKGGEDLAGRETKVVKLLVTFFEAEKKLRGE